MAFRDHFRAPNVFITAHGLWDAALMIALVCSILVSDGPIWPWSEAILLTLVTSLVAQLQLIGACATLAPTGTLRVGRTLWTFATLVVLVIVLTMNPIMTLAVAGVFATLSMIPVAFAALGATLAYGRRQFVRFPALGAPPIEPWQFELRHLFWAPLLVAIPLGIGRLLVEQPQWTTYWHALLLMVIIFAGLICGLVWGFGVSTIIPLWAAFQLPRPVAGFVLHVITLVVCGMLLDVLSFRSLNSNAEYWTRFPWDMVIGLSVVYATLTTGTLWWARRCGYRLVPIHAPPEADQHAI